MSTALKNISPAEYLASERKAEVKSEFFQGEVFAMAGGSPAHSLIAANFAGETRQFLKDKPCVVYNSDLRIKVQATGLHTYPDASIVCGDQPPGFLNKCRDRGIDELRLGWLVSRQAHSAQPSI